jgi:tRNA 2-thiocytidine biosynthesis protein TtcA
MARERRRGIEGRIRRRLGRARADSEMTAAGDKVLVARSGGKASLARLHILEPRKAGIPVSYRLRPVHVSLSEGGSSERVIHLRNQVAALGLELEVVETDIGRRLATETLSESPCFHCARWKRKALFDYAAGEQITKIAFGHHRDDLLETALMNLFYASNFSTMRPRQDLFGGRLVIIRPLAYLDEADIIAYCRKKDLPIESPPCPFQSENGRRRAMKELLRKLEAENPQTRDSLFHALWNVRNEYLLKRPGRKDSS